MEHSILKTVYDITILVITCPRNLALNHGQNKVRNSWGNVVIVFVVLVVVFVVDDDAVIVLFCLIPKA